MIVMQTTNIEALRNDYSNKGIDPKTLTANPFDFFSRWFDQALNAGIAEPNGMVMATVNQQGAASQRTVLMKSFDRNGFYFYTNYSSQKARDLAHNSGVSCLFPWLELHRQVSIQGTVTKATRGQSEQYFSIRPRDSQIGAWASRQSEVMKSRKVFDQEIAEMEEKFAAKDVPLPEFWGGYHVNPTRVEFWQGRSSRLHDRFVYSLTDPERNRWSMVQLYP